MHPPVSIQEKRLFIHWFLDHYKLKSRASVWILNYVVKYNGILENIHFVREVKSCPRGIMITSVCSVKPAFYFYKEHLVTTDTDKAFHDIRLNEHQALYIQLNFKNAEQNIEYAGVLEENPFTKLEDSITAEDKQLTKDILNQTLYDYQKKTLEEKIDRALDELNQKEFIKLVQKLQELNDTL